MFAIISEAAPCFVLDKTRFHLFFSPSTLELSCICSLDCRRVHWVIGDMMLRKYEISFTFVHQQETPILEERCSFCCVCVRACQREKKRERKTYFSAPESSFVTDQSGRLVLKWQMGKEVTEVGGWHHLPPYISKECSCSQRRLVPTPQVGSRLINVGLVL